MEQFLIFIAVLCFGIMLGWHLREQYAMRVVNQLLKDVQETKEQEEGERTKMRLERNGGFIYAFENDTDAFIAQGTDLIDLDKNIVAKFPGRKFSVQEQNLIDIKADYHEPV